MKKNLFDLISLCVVGLTLLRCGDASPKAETVLRPVRSTVVTTNNGSLNRRFSGTVRAGTAIKLSFRISGTVNQIPVKAGQKIKKGDFIASLDVADLQLKFDQAVAQENNAKIQMQTANANLDRVRGLYENNNVALSEYEAAKNQFAASQSQYETSRKATNLQRSQLSYGKIYAPMDGFIGAVQVEKNENIQSGTPIAVLNSQGDLEIAIGVPESFISRIAVGDTASVSVPALNGASFPGVVAEVSYALESGSFTYPVNIRLSGDKGQLRPGMAAEVALTVKQAQEVDQLVIPTTAVAEDQSGRFVYILEDGASGRAVIRRRNVVVGALSDDGFAVLEGLEPGQEIVTAGVNKIHDGLEVRRID